MCTPYLSSLFRIICLSEFHLPRLAMLLTIDIFDDLSALYLRLLLPGVLDLALILVEAGCTSMSLQNSIYLISRCNLAYFYVSHKVFFVNNLMPSAFVLIQVLGWSIFLILLPVAVLRIARICEGENRLWRQPGRATYMQDNNDFKIDRVILGSLSPRNKLFE